MPNPSASPPRKGSEPITDRRRCIVAVAIGTGTAMSTITLSIVNMALPTMATAFEVDLTSISWVILAYFGTVSGLHLSMGRLADLFGPKRVFLSGYVVFAMGSLCAAYSPSFDWLIASRVLQAIGASVLQANEAALFTSVYPPEQRGRALGMMSLAASAGMIVGPLLGGVILKFADWPAIFLLLVPWAVLAFIAGLVVIPSIPANRDGRFDSRGSVYLVLWVAPIVFALNRGFRIGWNHPAVLLAIATFVVFFLFFIRRQKRATDPLIDPSLFGSFDFRTGVIVAYLGFVSLSSVLLLAPFVLQNVVGIPVGQMGSFLAIHPAIALLLSVPAGRCADRFGFRMPRTIGVIALGAGCSALGLLHADATWIHIVTAFILLGFGQVFWGTSNMSAIMGGVPSSKRGTGGGFIAATRTFGWASGQALWGGIFAFAVLTQSGMGDVLDAPMEAQVFGFRVAFLLATSLTLVTAFLSARKSSLSRDMPGNDE